MFFAMQHMEGPVFHGCGDRATGNTHLPDMVVEANQKPRQAKTPAAWAGVFGRPVHRGLDR